MLKLSIYKKFTFTVLEPESEGEPEVEPEGEPSSKGKSGIYEECGSSKSCLGVPKDCLDSSNCKLFASWKKYENIC